MDRFTISLEEELLLAFDEFIANKAYKNRSEAVRDLIRDKLGSDRIQTKPNAAECVACLSYVYNHHERELARRLVNIQHNHFELTVSSMHAHLDHDNCLETVILKGPLVAVQKCADAIAAETGIHHAKLNSIPIKPSNKTHHFRVKGRPART